MALIPKRTKYRRPHKLRYDGVSKGNTFWRLWFNGNGRCLDYTTTN